MITLSKNGNAIVFTFEDSQHYLVGDGVIEVPVNSLALVTDNSQMATFKKAASNDIFVSATYAEFGKTKDELISWYKENMVGATGGGGSGSSITSGDVQTMITTALEDYPTIEDVSEDLEDYYTKDEVDAGFSSVTSSITAAVSGKADTTAVTEEISAAVSGLAQSSAVTAINSSLTAHTANTDIHTTSAEKSVWNAKLDASAYTPTDLSNYYTKSEIDADEAVTAAALNALQTNKLDASAYTPTDLSAYYTSAQTNAAITQATSGKVDTTAITTSVTSASTDSQIPSAKAVFDAIPTGGTGGNANIVEVTQAEYDALVSGQTVDPTVLYIITDADEIDTSNLVQTSAMTAALSEKVDTSAITTSVTSASTDSQIPSAKAVYDAIPTGGTGAAYSAGTNISIDTANTISCTLPLIGINASSIKQSSSTSVSAPCSLSAVFGYYNNISMSNLNYIFMAGFNNVASNDCETVFGRYNKNNRSSSTFGHSGNTLFAVGNGAYHAEHNAFEIRQNGDIYCNNGTSDVKLQDYLQVKIVQISQSDYDALVQGGTVDSNTLYLVTNVVS